MRPVMRPMRSVTVLSACLFAVVTAGQSGAAKIPRSRHTDGIAALLSESLANQRAQACPGEKAVLACPKHTQIQLSNTFYGRLVPSAELCPPKEKARGKGKKKAELDLWDDGYEDTSCVVSNANAKVTEKCEHKRKCRVPAKPKTFDQDPCPTTSKYLHISYKCKPSEFNSEYFCEGSPMLLSCNSKRRLALYSAVYGRTVDSQAISCPSKTAINYDCTVDVLPHLMARCHAQRECSLNVQDSLLGNPCPLGVAKYLTLIFMCVNENVFNEAALKGELGAAVPLLPPPPTPPEKKSVEEEETFSSEEKEFPLDFQPPLPPVTTTLPTTTQQPKLNNDAAYAPVLHPDAAVVGLTTAAPRPPPTTCLPPSVPNAIGFVTTWIDTWEYAQEHYVKFLMYFGLSAAGALGLVLILCIYHVAKRVPPKREPRDSAGSVLLPRAQSPDLHSPPKLGLDGHSDRYVYEPESHRMDDVEQSGVSFMRFNHPTPPRNSGSALPPSLYGTYQGPGPSSSLRSSTLHSQYYA